jgi:Uma2 family endonuclease
MVQQLLTLPPLENGDHLDREEFERRYQEMSQVKKAELIVGIVYMSSPVRVVHSQPHADLMTWLGYYRANAAGVAAYDNPTLRLDDLNEPQPDALLRLETGGGSWIADDDYLAGVPELVVEIAASSASYDLHEKLRVYEQHGIPEYLVWRTFDRAIDWFIWHEGRYQSLTATAVGILCSQQFPGLWLDPMALIQGDLARVLGVLQQDLAGSAHQAFVER